MVSGQEEIGFKRKYPNENYVSVQVNTVLKVSVNGTIEFDHFKFGSTQVKHFGKPIVLPKLNSACTTVETEERLSPNIESILYIYYKSISKLQVINHFSKHTFWIIRIILSITLVFRQKRINLDQK